MKNPSFVEESEHDCFAVLWRFKLSKIPSTFGRLLYFSSLRDFNTGRYSAHFLVEEFGADNADTVFRYCHNLAFADWLAYTLEEQVADLDLYLSVLLANKETVLCTWLRLEPFRNLIPEEVDAVERELFLGDLQVVLALMRARVSA